MYLLNVLAKCTSRVVINSHQWAYCMFFCVHYCYRGTRKQKQGGQEMIREAVRKMEKNLIIIIVAFLSGLCLIGQNMAFCHLQNIYLDNF